MTERAFTWLLAALATFAILAAPARADTPESEVRYRAVVDEALRELSLQHWSEARVLFEEAHALSPSAQTLRALGVTAFELRRYGTAIQRLRAALEDSRRPLSASQREEAEGLLTRAARFVGEIELQDVPPGARVEVDGQHVDLSSSPRLQLGPGLHVLTVSRGEEQSWRRELRVTAGQRTTVWYESKPAPPTPPQPTPLADPPTRAEPRQRPGPTPQTGGTRHDGYRAWALSLTAGAGVMGATAVGLAWLTRQRHNEFRDCTPNCDEPLAAQGQRSERATNVLVGLAAVTAATGLGLWIRGRRTSVRASASLNPTTGDSRLSLDLRF